MTTTELSVPSVAEVQTTIVELEGREPFMLAADLADFYDVKTEAIGQAVKRNPDRFPEAFCFRLTEAEVAKLKSQTVISTKANRDFPLGFTEAGALALSGVLRSARATEVSVLVFSGFVAMRQQRREEAATEISDLRSMLARCQSHLMIALPKWAAIREASWLGAAWPYIARKARLPQNATSDEWEEMQRCGIVAARDWNDRTPRSSLDRIRDLEFQLRLARAKAAGGDFAKAYAADERTPLEKIADGDTDA